MTATITDLAETDDTIHRLVADAAPSRPQLGYGWYAIKAKPASDRLLVRDLKQLKLETYRPVSTHYQRKSSGKQKGKKVKIQRPLFPGYVFVCCSIADDYERIRKLHTFAKFVLRAGTVNPFRFPDMKIGDLMMRQKFGEFDEQAPKEGKYQPAKGDRVLVIAGKWYGYFAEVLGLVSKKKRVVIRFDEGGAEKEIENSQLTPEAA